ncbi:hypothetical protein [Ornithinimicrobium sufpigmenti]|uniref:hypothetical protein n=1 Tax=Ornithinimicrobium sufpigmenti TaxID=2508882 RepID=UPI00103651CD|nr:MULTISPECIES: hypothetical protein [unclassified Ornithinimicrobium]
MSTPAQSTTAEGTTAEGATAEGTTKTRRTTWLAAGGGVILGAVATIAVLYGLGWGPDDGLDESTITLPETADGLRTETAVVEDLRGEPLAGREEALTETAELLSASRGGAATAVQAYASDDYDERFTVWAVADESPSLWSDQESEALAELMGLKTSMEWVERDGNVECLVEPAMPMLDGSDRDVELRVGQCQLVQEGMTLVLTGMGDGTLTRPAAVLRDVAENLTRG